VSAAISRIYQEIASSAAGFLAMTVPIHFLSPALPRNLLNKIPYIMVEENELKIEEI